MPSTLEYTDAVAKRTEHIYPKVKDSIPRFEWEMHAPLIVEINRLKAELNAVILGHNYMVPEIFHGISDYTGDSLGLSKQAKAADADIIVFCGVHFMAETAKILNPSRTVLIPDLDAGCSLSESITAEDVRLLRERYPGVPIVTYMNTPAAIKAERAYREQFPGIEVIAHPECSPEVCEASDFVGSTTGMIGYLDRARSNHVIMVTECSMSDNVQEAHPNLEFVKPCTLCPHMKRISLEKTLESLQKIQHEIHVPEDIRVRALRAVERMIEIQPDPVNADPTAAGAADVGAQTAGV
jgi:quinolinate synthase